MSIFRRPKILALGLSLGPGISRCEAHFGNVARHTGSLDAWLSYCTQALRLSEDAACTRIDVARTCRRFPAILDLLASGEVTLTTAAAAAPASIASSSEPAAVAGPPSSSAP